MTDQRRAEFDAFESWASRTTVYTQMEIWRAACAWQRERDAEVCDDFARASAEAWVDRGHTGDFVAMTNLRGCAAAIRSEKP